MNAELIAVGTELLLGFTVNQDTAFLGRVLAGLGIPCRRQVTVGDNPGRLAQALRTGLRRADLVITCGGLGPTVDDVTLGTIARVARRKLIPHPATRRAIQARFRRIGIPMPASNLRQALLPRGASVFPNSVGTAPGFLLKIQNLKGSDPAGSDPKVPKVLVALPGPPAELIPMVQRHLVPLLRRHAGRGVILSRTLKSTGLTESEVDARVRDLLALAGPVTVGIYAHPAQVDLRITARARNPRAARALIRRVERRIRSRLGNGIFGADDETLEEVVGRLLRKRKLNLSIAESCTGGLVAERITRIPGASDYFRGGVVAYANSAKERPIGVPGSLLRRFGAVSPQVASDLAGRIRKLIPAHVGLSVTGIAGPTGGSRAKPVGLVWIALSGRGGNRAWRFRFTGERQVIQFKASQAALNLLRLHLIPAR